MKRHKVSVAWNDYGNSNIIGDIMDCMNSWILNSGEYWDFTLSMNRETLAQIFQHPEIRTVLFEYPQSHYLYEMLKDIHVSESLLIGEVLVFKGNDIVDALQVL